MSEKTAKRTSAGQKKGSNRDKGKNKKPKDGKKIADITLDLNAPTFVPTGIPAQPVPQSSVPEGGPLA